MADERYQSLGPAQVSQVDIANVNLALAQVQEQLDQLRGLRGVTRVYNRLQVDDPVDDADAITARAGREAISNAVTPVEVALSALTVRVEALETTVTALQGTVSGHTARLDALEAHLAAMVAAVPAAAVTVALLPALTDAPATADALRDNLTSAWEPPLESNDAALAALANGLRTALLAT